MKLCETADVTSSLGSDLELLESIKCKMANFWSWKWKRTRDRERSYSEPEDPYIDKTLADEYWLREYYQETKEVERIIHTLVNLFDGTNVLET